MPQIPVCFGLQPHICFSLSCELAEPHFLSLELKLKQWCPGLFKKKHPLRNVRCGNECWIYYYKTAKNVCLCVCVCPPATVLLGLDFGLSHLPCGEPVCGVWLTAWLETVRDCVGCFAWDSCGMCWSWWGGVAVVIGGGEGVLLCSFTWV